MENKRCSLFVQKDQLLHFYCILRILSVVYVMCVSVYVYLSWCLSSLHNCLQVIVNFSASWCVPCRAIAPLYSELSEKHLSWMFLVVDVDVLSVSTQKLNKILKSNTRNRICILHFVVLFSWMQDSYLWIEFALIFHVSQNCLPNLATRIIFCVIWIRTWVQPGTSKRRQPSSSLGVDSNSKKS